MPYFDLDDVLAEGKSYTPEHHRGVPAKLTVQ